MAIGGHGPEGRHRGNPGCQGGAVIDPRSPAVRRAAAAAFVVYLLVLAGVAFLPLPGTPGPGRVGVVPISTSLSRPDLLGGWEAQRNVLMAVPFGLLLPLVARWR